MDVSKMQPDSAYETHDRTAAASTWQTAIDPAFLKRVERSANNPGVGHHCFAAGRTERSKRFVEPIVSRERAMTPRTLIVTGNGEAKGEAALPIVTVPPVGEAMAIGKDNNVPSIKRNRNSPPQNTPKIPVVRASPVVISDPRVVSRPRTSLTSPNPVTPPSPSSSASPLLIATGTVASSDRHDRNQVMMRINQRIDEAQQRRAEHLKQKVQAVIDLRWQHHRPQPLEPITSPKPRVVDDHPSPVLPIVHPHTVNPRPTPAEENLTRPQINPDRRDTPDVPETPKVRPLLPTQLPTEPLASKDYKSPDLPIVHRPTPHDTPESNPDRNQSPTSPPSTSWTLNSPNGSPPAKAVIGATQPVETSTNPNPPINPEMIAAQVERQMMRKLAIERERRGCNFRGFP